MSVKKPLIDTFMTFVYEQRRYFTDMEKHGKSDAQSPKNRDLRRVVKKYNGPVWLKLQTESGPYMLELVKTNFLQELKVVDEQPSDFAIDPAHTDENKICIMRVSYARVFD